MFDDEWCGPGGDLVASFREISSPVCLFREDNKGSPSYPSPPESCCQTEAGELPSPRSGGSACLPDPSPRRGCPPCPGRKGREPEIGVDMFAIRYRRVRSPGCSAVCALVGNRLPQDFLPCDPSVGTPNRQNREPLGLGGLDTSRSTAFPLRLRWRARPGGFAGRNSGQNEDGVLPDDGGGGALAGNLGLPGDVRLLAPHHRRIGVGRDSGGERAAPLRPVTIDRGFAASAVQSSVVNRQISTGTTHACRIEVSSRLAAQE